MVIKTWSCNFVQLLWCFVRQFAISFHAFLCMTFHIIGPAIDVCIRFPWTRYFLYVQLTSWIQTYPCNSPQYLCLFDILFECNPNSHGQGMMLVLPNQRLSVVFSILDWCSASFQPVLYRPHTPIRTVLVLGQRRNIPNLELYTNRTSIGFSQIAFPIAVLPKNDRTDFAQEERLDLPYWTMISTNCFLADVSTCRDILTLGFSTTTVHLPFWPGYRRILHLLLVLRILVVLT